MMWITHHEAIEMYARFCRAHYGPAAGDTVRDTPNIWSARATTKVIVSGMKSPRKSKSRSGPA